MVKSEEVAAYIYHCFSTWEESSFYELSELNQQGWLQYADDIMAIIYEQVKKDAAE